MIREGKYIEDEFNLSIRAYTKWYPTFNFELIIGEYEGYKIQNTFFEDLKASFEHFIASFPFIKLWELNLSGSLFRDEKDTRYRGTGTELVYKIFANYNESRLPIIFADPDGEEILAIFLGLEYQNIEGETTINNQYGTIQYGIEKRNDNNQLVFYLEWGCGAEWFYNKYKEENRAIVRKAIIDFYESSPNYQELSISYYLRGFDLEIEKYTEKKVLIRKNLG